MATVAPSQEQHDGFPLKPESTRLKISFSPEGHNAPPLQKTFLVKDGQEAMLETLLRRAFGVPQHLTVSLVLDGDIICCPVHLIDLNEARRAKEIELQTFPSTQALPTTFAPQPAVSAVPHVEFPETYAPPPAPQPSAPLTAAKPKSKSTSRSGSANNVADLAASPPAAAADGSSSSGSAPAKRPAASKRARKAPAEAPSSGSHLIAGDADGDSDGDGGGALDGSREDRRKNNRGLDHRRSYLKEEKILVMWLKDCGRSADEIAQLTRVSKSNVEKWCSDKTRDKILAKYRHTSAGSGAGDVLASSLDANGLHFLATDKFAMQSALLFLLDRLRTLSSESHMVVDEDALFAAADLTRHSQTPYAAAALGGGHGFYVAHMPVQAAQMNYLPPLARELSEKVHASVAQQAFAQANKRARIGEAVQSQSQQLLQQAASLLGAFNRAPEGAAAAVEEDDEDDDEDDEESAREMLEQMLHQRRASLGLASAAPPAAKKWSALDVLSAAAAPVDVDALPKTFGAGGGVSAKAPPAPSTGSAPSSSSSSSATALPLSALPPLLPRYENVRMEYTDQFALSVAAGPANDAVPPDAASNGATPRESAAAEPTAAPLSTAGVVQAQRQLLPSTKFLLHLRPQLLQQQDEEDAAVLTLLGE
eukprot:gene9671-6921_t